MSQETPTPEAQLLSPTTQASAFPPPANAYSLRMADFDYPLPDLMIANHPARPRRSARLLVYKGGEITDAVVNELPDFLPEGTLFFANDVRVVPSRLHVHTPAGHPIEVFSVEPVLPASPEAAQSARGEVTMRCMIGRNRKWIEGDTLVSFWTKDGRPGSLHIQRGERHAELYDVHFSWTPADLCWAEVQAALGVIPLPPYLHRKPEKEDYERYQTVFAAHEGAVAAPTAGLHFDEVLLGSLERKGIVPCFLTLYVSAGTFRPVSADTPAGHGMHAERISVPRAVIERLRASSSENDKTSPIVALGTTSLRTLESLYHLGVKFLREPALAAIPPSEALPSLAQWEAYAEDTDFFALSDGDVYDALLAYLDRHSLTHFEAHTALMCIPGYQFRVVDGLFTNFHQPSSTLLLLVAAFIGEKAWQGVYKHALAEGYRFLSYGDASLLWRS
jgi:S-adenosylmethionine:tRNA ribosyltransferase-isomerase